MVNQLEILEMAGPASRPGDILSRRSAGVLLHLTSLPGGDGVGDLGNAAWQFVDFLAESGQHVWQTLPINPPGRCHSPYDTISTFAGSPALISLESLVQWGLLRRGELPETRFSGRRTEYRRSIPIKRRALLQALARLDDHTELRPAFEIYQEQERGWLDDFALFVALKKADPGTSWTDWEPGLRARRAGNLNRSRRELAPEVRFQRFLQFIFDRQWQALRGYAHERDVHLVGDVPFYVAHESADVWANAHLFDLSARGRLRSQAGVPPDLFSRSGQLWGNPTYNWEVMERDGFRWWVDRIRSSLGRFDAVRLDHLIGFHRAWCVAARGRTARHGKWRPGPGSTLFDAIHRALGRVPLIVEDLGLVTSEVEELRESIGHPGLRVLQFAFDGNPDNVHLPHTYPESCVAYTGTHDNTTLMGWYGRAGAKAARGSASRAERERARRYAGCRESEFPWAMIRILMESKARTVIIPVQDLLGMGDDARMNTPGTTRGNWMWRLPEGRLTPEIVETLRQTTARYHR